MLTDQDLKLLLTNVIWLWVGIITGFLLAKSIKIDYEEKAEEKPGKQKQANVTDEKPFLIKENGTNDID